MSYWLHDEAERELGDAAVYYAEQATQKSLSRSLLRFERVVALLQLNQQLGTRKAEGMRSYPFQRFPYSIMYREGADDGPQAYAVAHQHREPGYWQERQ